MAGDGGEGGCQQRPDGGGEDAADFLGQRELGEAGAAPKNSAMVTLSMAKRLRTPRFRPMTMAMVMSVCCRW